MEIKTGNKDIVWSYLGTCINMAVNFVMLPISMYYLDGNMLGLWYVFMAIGSFALLVDVGFSVTFARNLTYCWSGSKTVQSFDAPRSNSSGVDYELMKKILLSCRIIYLRLSLLAFGGLIIIGSAYIWYISRLIDGYMHFVAWIIFDIAIFLNLYYGYFASFLKGVGAISLANKNVIISRLIQLFLTLALLICGMDILAISVGYLVYGTIFRYLGKYSFYNYKNIGKELNGVDVVIGKKDVNPIIRKIWYNAWRDGVISVSNFVNNQACTIICSLFLTLSQTAVYSIGVQLSMAIATISGTLYTAYQPEIQSSYVQGNIERIRKLMSRIINSLVVLFFIGTICCVFIALPILQKLKPDITVSNSVLISLCIYQFILQIRNSYTSYFSCTNRIIYMHSFIVSSLICICLALVLTGGFKMGIWGLVCSQIVSQIIFNVWYWPYLAHKEFYKK